MSQLVPQPSPLWALITNATQSAGRVGRVVAWAIDTTADVPTLLPVIARNGAQHAAVVDGEDRVELFDTRGEADARLARMTGAEPWNGRMPDSTKRAL